MNTSCGPRRYRLKRTDRLSVSLPLSPGQTVYAGDDGYGCANDDSRRTGIEHIAISLEVSGQPFYTIPREDVEILTDEVLPSPDILKPPAGSPGESASLDPETKRASTGRRDFSVFQFFLGGEYECVARLVDEDNAVRAVASCISSVGAKVGTTRRVIITDDLDVENFEWRYGEGIVFPPH